MRRCSSSRDRPRRKADGAPDTRRTDSHDPRTSAKRPSGRFAAGGFLFPRARRILFWQDKREWGAYPRRGDPCTGRTLPAPAKNHHNCPSKSRQNRQNVPLTGTHRRGIVSSNLKKGIEKDADRERQQRGAAIGCKRLLPITGPQPPPWSRPPICRLGRDLPLQRTRAALLWERKQGGTVEYVCSYLTPDFSSGVGFFFTPRTRRKHHERGKHLHL